MVRSTASGEETAAAHCCRIGVHDINNVCRDAVLTCFFLDTAKNIFQYIETIAACLKPGGCWINLGPLLYHFEEMDEVSTGLYLTTPAEESLWYGNCFLEQTSIELSMEEIYAVMESYGLDRVHQEDGAKLPKTHLLILT